MQKLTQAHAEEGPAEVAVQIGMDFSGSRYDPALQSSWCQVL